MRLVSQEDFDKAKSRELVHIYCDHCDADFTRLKHHAMRSAKRGDGNCYCSRQCCSDSHSNPLGPCLVCGVHTKTKFCSQRCSGLFSSTGRFRLPRILCKVCGKETSNEFCSSACRKNYKVETRIQNWISGKISGATLGGDVCGFVKEYLFKTLGRKCTICGWCKINPATGKSPIQIEHIDGDFRNCSRENLTILCPNCHSLTPTFMALNKGKGRTRRTELRKARIAQQEEHINGNDTTGVRGPVLAPFNI